MRILALLVKWWWRFGDEEKRCEEKIIVPKYIDDKQGWVPKRILGYV